MYLPVIEALLHRGADQPVLVDPREALELRRFHVRAEVLAVTGFVKDFDFGAGQRSLNRRLQFPQADHLHCQNLESRPQ